MKVTVTRDVADKRMDMDFLNNLLKSALEGTVEAVLEIVDDLDCKQDLKTSYIATTFMNIGIELIKAAVMPMEDVKTRNDVYNHAITSLQELKRRPLARKESDSDE